MKSSPHRPSIELLFKRGLGSAEIARRLQISSSTVRNVVAAIKKRGDASEVKKSGRPRSVNTRNTRAIIKKRIIRNDGLSLNRMASQLGIARSTVQSIVKNDLKLKSYKLRRGQYLSDKSKAMRLEKCRKLLQHFQIDALQDFILSTVSFLVSSIFYLLTIVLVVKNLKYPPPAFPAPNMLVKTKRFTLSPTEMLIFKCAFGSFLLFVPNFVKTTVLYFATDPLVVNAATDLWYFTTELMCVSSAWSLLLSSRRIREEFVPEMRNPFLERSTIGSTSRVLTM
uniref:HTH luxR-type domain-containing protein n=1 Tax=Caenorhabditis japonica TaxID=281687 RepID=A0A8R1ES48_CAEJA